MLSDTRHVHGASKDGVQIRGEANLKLLPKWILGRRATGIRSWVGVGAHTQRCVDAHQHGDSESCAHATTVR